MLLLVTAASCWRRGAVPTPEPGRSTGRSSTDWRLPVVRHWIGILPVALPLETAAFTVTPGSSCRERARVVSPRTQIPARFVIWILLL